MSHLSPAAFLVWAILSSLLGVFLVWHLWSFDRFKCLRWSQGSQGSFKRVMTYSYLLSVPLIWTYSVGFAIIKYSEGFMVLPGFGVIPVPHQLWKQAHQNAILPLYLAVAFAWALEMVTHLEELCFWLFVVNAGSAQRDWFRSLYFKTWLVGSVVAILYVPLVTIFTRSDPLKCEAYTFLAGSLGSLSLTLWFIPVLHLFGPFLRSLRKEGVDMTTIVRLTKFHELNTIRVVFRLLFSLPIIILAVDGVRPHQHVNDSLIGTDLLAMVAGFGVVLSSGLTLVIFFPRSIEGEISRNTSRNRGFFSSKNHLTFVSQEQELYGTYDVRDTEDPDKEPPPSSIYEESIAVAPSTAWRQEAQPPSADSQYPPPPPLPKVTTPQSAAPERPLTIRLEPNRRVPEPDIELRPQQAVPKLTADNLAKHNSRAKKVAHFVQNFKSPIDFRRSR
ncbi:hypothetical protein FA95DRAFT_1563648 [Auriscalpium vulgare]|uniref:Uncharacterized protein n=1 Tax=Auriscalpium vulgare TaxID=40419 RepID=A0ACB8RHD5_9AGAM|nr:hypothetical protein FA95DRAFT_1563648 [Auriscalpium vulgare]